MTCLRELDHGASDVEERPRPHRRTRRARARRPRPASPLQRVGVLADTQILCGAGPYEVDILIREFPGSERVEIVGQVTHSDSLHEPVRGLKIAAVGLSDAMTLTEAVTDDFGEFVLAPPAGGCFGLRLGDSVDAPMVPVWEEAA